MELPATSGLNAQPGNVEGTTASTRPATALSVAERYLEALPLPAEARAE
ncbi:hypothetical protein [Ralstonia pseudosolanacearum]